MAIRGKIEAIVQKAAGKMIDRRCHFYDISRTSSIPLPKSRVLQFYSSVHNIGNYTPVLGIQEMLGFKPDVWNVHHAPIDFSYVNDTYRAIIVGGAGLFFRAFEPFWTQLAKSCRLPMAIWGVGGCFIDKDREPAVSRSIVREVAARSQLINVRDTLTAEYYGLDRADISPCPTIAWLENWVRNRDAKRVLFASHTNVVPEVDERRIMSTIQTTTRERVLYTDNMQRSTCGLEDIIKRRYCKSTLVVSTRLHGAIIAYGLGIPYVVIPWDEKVRAFHREWGNGYMATDTDELRRFLSSSRSVMEPLNPLPTRNVREFGNRVRSWLDANRASSPPAVAPV